ncbi:Repeat domain-containing protein [Zobellia uliginosa]|uniref:Repeat domain-containing protein n=1 Tax=Zobellia uliginosa TaxID=143224 RepID=A0ABY1KJY0_9FLAO|nr:VCBS repeat-containing protein [Zobellia uliginosa]SIS43051.1 Repeat domain-containing protein [Zobellia uliginosa]
MIRQKQIKRSACKLSLIGILGLLISSCTPKNSKSPIFKLLPSTDSSIDFINTLSENDTTNILDFEFMFNGGGVAIGDIDNDGLQDIYFSGNQVPGKLYRNLGNLKFKDITKEANVETTGWCNGVAFHDVNQDGFIDMYISKGGPRNTSEEKMANLLYLNNGDGTFKEVAKTFGVADTGYSIQSVFFDYDKDGDLDLYLLTNALVPYNRNTSRPKITNGEAPSTDRLYRNNGDNTFTDISKEAGITIEGFGLGVAVCDLNQDGWLDIYVSNDFLTNDILYINNGDGTFSDKITDYLKHQSYNGMGLNISDINNDALSDIVVLDMMPQDNKRLKQTIGYFSYDKLVLDTDFGYTPQYVRNTLQLNNGNGSFSEIGQLSGISATDWSWSPLIADFDNDGFKDIFITNGYRRDVTNLDFIVYGQQQGPFGDPTAIHKEKLKKLKALPEVKLHNYIYKNKGNLTFEDKSLDWGIDTPSYSNGAAYADLDNDGDLDLVVNNIDDKAHLYQNMTISATDQVSDSTNYISILLQGLDDFIGSEVTLYTKDTKQYQFYSPVKGYLSTMDNRLHFGLGATKKIDSLKITWPNGTYQVLTDVPTNQSLLLKYQEAEAVKVHKQKDSLHLFKEISDDIGITYQHKEKKFIDFNAQPTLIKMTSRLGPGMAVGDINGDGLEDFYIGGGKGQNGSFFIQQANGSFTERILENGESHEDMGALLIDIDHDNDLDLLVISGGERTPNTSNDYTDRLYTNDGNGVFSESTLFTRPNSGSFIRAADFDKDGDIDLFIGGRYIDGSYPLSPKSYLLVNENGSFVDATQTVLQGNGELGMLSDALFTDFDNDSFIDLILVGEYMSPIFLKNEKGVFNDVSKHTGIKNANGWWNSIASADFDMDGDTDYILGNLGLNSCYKVSPEEPMTIYAKDFDKNGAIDPITTTFLQGQEQIIHARDVLSSQINAMKARFRTFESYANTPFDQAFSEEELKDTYTLKAEMFSSAYLENLGNGKFKTTPLPLEAQFAPIFGMEVQDYNNDNNPDLLLVGNMHSVEALTGAYDAFSGLCLLGDGEGNFKAVNTSESGLKIDGDAKAIVQLQSANGEPVVVASQNLGPVKAYTYASQKETIPIAPNEAYAIIHPKNGSPYKQEFHYGNSYLSQTSRSLKIDPKTTETVEIFSFLGQMRQIKISHEE